MKKTLFCMAVLLTALSCSQPSVDEMATDATRKKIEGALSKINPHRLGIAESILLQGKADVSLKEIVAIDKASGFKSMAFVEIPKGADAAHLGQWTGWLLYGDGCFYHGTFTYLGDDPYDWTFFVPDSNPYGDNYVGNEPHCLTDDQLDSIC